MSATSEAGARQPVGAINCIWTTYLGNYHNGSTLVAQLYGLPHGILRVFNTILYENEFQNPQIFQQTISLFLEQSTLVVGENTSFFSDSRQSSYPPSLLRTFSFPICNCAALWSTRPDGGRHSKHDHYECICLTFVVIALIVGGPHVGVLVAWGEKHCQHI
jgi:hypothetical protein